MHRNLSRYLAIVAMLCAWASVSHAQIGPEHAGHWNSPDLERQGLNITAWPDQPDGREAGAVVFWYTYEVDGPGQVWFISDIFGPDEVTETIYLTAGAFPGLYVEPPIGQPLEPVGTLSIVPTGPNRLSVEYVVDVFPARCDPRPKVSPRPPDCRDRLRFERLTPPIVSPPDG